MQQNSKLERENSMNETIKHQLNHRTFRKYIADKEVPQETVDLLIDVALQTASHMHMQAWSIIRVTDPDLRQQFFTINKQPYIVEVSELWIFLVDCHRNFKIVEGMGYTGQAANTMDRFMQGYIDACMAAQNVLNAVESLGMGGVYFGSISRDYKKTCELLDLPQMTFPVVGLGFGYPAEDWVVKPRLPREFRVFENTYKDDFDGPEAIKAYDEAMSQYCDQRRPNQPEGPFTDMLLNLMENVYSEESSFLQHLKDQGFRTD